MVRKAAPTVTIHICPPGAEPGWNLPETGLPTAPAGGGGEGKRAEGGGARSGTAPPPCVLRKSALGTRRQDVWRDTRPSHFISLFQTNSGTLICLRRQTEPPTILLVRRLNYTQTLIAPPTPQRSLWEKFSGWLSHKQPAALICVISPSINLLSVTMWLRRDGLAPDRP